METPEFDTVPRPCAQHQRQAYLKTQGLQLRPQLIGLLLLLFFGHFLDLFYPSSLSWDLFHLSNPLTRDTWVVAVPCHVVLVLTVVANCLGTSSVDVHWLT